MTLKRIVLIPLLTLLVLLQGCGTLHATAPNPRGQEVMLLGYDPVAYFTGGKPTRGNKDITVTLPGRTYYFASEENKRLFEANPTKYEPQYGGFCSSGAAYGVKLGSDPTAWEIVNGRLFIFGDVLGHEQWAVYKEEHIKYSDQVWPSIKDKGWRAASLAGYVSKVPWYRTGKQLNDEYEHRNPGKKLTYDPGGMFTNLFLKRPGWRAAEGFGQEKLGWPQ